MALPPAKSTTPQIRQPSAQAVSGTVIAPDAYERAAKKAEAEREAIHAAGHRQGAQDLHRWRVAALILFGFVLGCAFAGIVMTRIYENGVMTSGAIADRILSRTIEQPGVPVAPITVHAPDVTPATPPGCSSGERLANGHHCPPQPLGAP